MNTLDLLLLAVGLSMDAFAVSICKGLSLGKISWRHMVLAGLWFGIFQALMPAIGYGLGSFFADMIDAYDHWVTFILLGAIGLNCLPRIWNSSKRLPTAARRHRPQHDQRIL